MTKQKPVTQYLEYEVAKTCHRSARLLYVRWAGHNAHVASVHRTDQIDEVIETMQSPSGSRWAKKDGPYLGLLNKRDLDYLQSDGLSWATLRQWRPPEMCANLDEWGAPSGLLHVPIEWNEKDGCIRYADGSLAVTKFRVNVPAKPDLADRIRTLAENNASLKVASFWRREDDDTLDLALDIDLDQKQAEAWVSQGIASARFFNGALSFFGIDAEIADDERGYELAGPTPSPVV